MLTRITVFLEEDERSALEILATQELRGLRDQIRFVLRETVQQRGLLPRDQVNQQNREVDHAIPA